MVVVKVLEEDSTAKMVESSSMNAELNASNLKRVLKFIDSTLTAVETRKNRKCVITISYQGSDNG